MCGTDAGVNVEAHSIGKRAFVGSDCITSSGSSSVGIVMRHVGCSQSDCLGADAQAQ